MKRTLFSKTLAVVLCMVMALSLSAFPVFAADTFTGTFEITGGSAAIDVYYTQDYTSADETGAVVAYARDGDTGEFLTDGNGQINFKVNPADGYAVESVTATDGTYKNIKLVDADTYRITKITADLVIMVTLTVESEIDTSDPVITFTDSAAAVTSGSASGVDVSGTSVKITAAGTYTFTGSCSNGSIVVKKGVTGVTLILDGLTLSASATAPITCNKGSGVTIVAAVGSVNKLADDQYNNDDIYTDTTLYPDIENAVIKCKDGSNVTIGGTGTIHITSNGKNGIKGGYDLYEEDADGNATDTLLSTASLTIEDVTLHITANVNDGLKSDKELNILSGNITVSAADDGIKSDYVMNIGADGTTGPTINVIKSTEGIEAATLNVYSGNIKVSATDDGINAANSDLTNYSFSYNQYGGYVWINVTNGDGVDSNGKVNLMGGTLEVYAPSQGDGDPLDADGGVTFGGATVLGVGHNTMQQSYSGTYVTFGNSGGMFGGSSNLVTAGSTISVKDASGNTLCSGTAVRAASYVVFSGPALTANGSYTLYNGSSAVGTATATAASSGGPGGNGGNGPGNNDHSGNSFSGVSSFFQTIIQWFQRIINWFRNMFHQ